MTASLGMLRRILLRFWDLASRSSKPRGGGARIRSSAPLFSDEVAEKPCAPFGASRSGVGGVSVFRQVTPLGQRLLLAAHSRRDPPLAPCRRRGRPTSRGRTRGEDQGPGSGRARGTIRVTQGRRAGEARECSPSPG